MLVQVASSVWAKFAEGTPYMSSRMAVLTLHLNGLLIGQWRCGLSLGCLTPKSLVYPQGDRYPPYRWFERGVKESIHAKVENPSLNRGGGLRHNLAPIFHAALSLVPRKIKGINKGFRSKTSQRQSSPPLPNQ